MSYRATPKDGGVSPAKAFLGREMRLAFMPNATVPMRQDEMAEEAAKARRGPLRVGRQGGDEAAPRRERFASVLGTEASGEGAGAVYSQAIRWEEMEFAQDQEDASGG